MCVGPTRGLAERPRPFFRHTLLEWGRGEGVAWAAPFLPPCTQPAGGGHRPSTRQPVKWLSGIASALGAIGFHVYIYNIGYLNASNPPTPSIFRVSVAPPDVIAGTSVYPPFLGCLSWIIAPATFVPFWSSIEE